MKTLLEQAREIEIKHKPRKTQIIIPGTLDEQLDVALAYCRGELGGAQVQAVFGCSHAAISWQIGRIGFRALKQGLLVRRKK